MKVYLQFGALVALVVTVTQALYEDQVGKFDWRQRYVGRPKYVVFDQSGQKNLILATEQNVIASLSARNGDIAWRQVLEEGDKGRVDGLHQSGTGCITLNGGNTVRAWSASSGHLLWEAVLQTDVTESAVSFLATKDSGGEYLLALYGAKLSSVDLISGSVAWTLDLPQSSNQRYELVSASGSSVHVAGRHGATVVMVTVSLDGAKQNEARAAGLAGEGDVCAYVGADHLVCGGDNGILRYVRHGSSNVQTLPVGVAGRVVSLESSACQDGSVLVDVGLESGRAILELRAHKLSLLRALERVTAARSLHGGEGDFMIALSRRSSEDVLLEKYRLDGNKLVQDGEQIMHIPEHHGQPRQIHGLAYKKRDGSTGYRYLVLCDDHSILMLTQNGKAAWLREEALASILSVEMVDLPVSETDQKIEDEFGSPDDGVLNMFKKRIMTQLSQLELLVEHVKEHLKGDSPQDAVETDAENQVDADVELTRDRFNLHKMIVIATGAGKLFGMYSQTGSLVWKRHLPNLAPFSRHRQRLPLILQRSTVHYPHPAQCLVLGQHRTSKHGFLITFDPITGVTSEEKDLGYNVKQLVSMSHFDEHFLKGVIIMDTEHKIHVYPSQLENLARKHQKEYFIFTADLNEGALNGYNIINRQENLIANELWNVNLMKETQTITNVVSKRSNEHVHSQGRVLADRNVLYKYLNPNLIVVTAQGTDTKVQGFLNVYLVDAVSGAVIFHANHKRVSGDVHVVHSENWVVYSYWNQKSRRHEMTVLELYEGHVQSNSTVFSSLEPPPLPLVMRQSYIFPTRLSAMGVTLTEKGVTNKHLLVALQMGGILELPMAFLDPRRPVEPTAEHREEGILPYFPELTLQADSIINYNQSLMNVRAIHTAPAGLESTSLVFVYGLDLFATRVFPSKMFDVLKEDFDYLFISAVVIGMILVSLVSQKLSSRKALHRNWK